MKKSAARGDLETPVLKVFKVRPARRWDLLPPATACWQALTRKCGVMMPSLVIFVHTLGRQRLWLRARLNSWSRIFLLGLFGSLFLHAVLLDLWRSGSADARRSRLILQARLASGIPQSPQQERVGPNVVRAPLGDRGRTATTSSGLPSGFRNQAGSGISVARGSPQIGSARSNSAVSGADEKYTGQHGWRPMSPLEWVITYRLALVSALRDSTLAASQTTRAWHCTVSLALAPDGKPAEVALLESTGDAQLDRTVLADVARAARRSPVPESLRDGVSTIELEVVSLPPPDASK